MLVVCPSSLVAKWKREMEERFGFELVELDHAGSQIARAELETDRVQRRAAYICSIERLRMWDELERATELGLARSTSSIVDEAHAFRNSDTRSYESR